MTNRPPHFRCELWTPGRSGRPAIKVHDRATSPDLAAAVAAAVVTWGRNWMFGPIYLLAFECRGGGAEPYSERQLWQLPLVTSAAQSAGNLSAHDLHPDHLERALTQGTNFTAHLLRLIAKADPENRECLRRTFPAAVEAYERWMLGLLQQRGSDAQHG